MQAKVLGQVVEMAGLAGPDQALPAAVRVKHGTSRGGKAVHYYLNFSGQAKTFPYPYASGEDVPTGKAIAKGAAVALAAWDLAAVEER